MSKLPVISNDQFSEVVFTFADEVGPGPIWELLVHPADEVPEVARSRADEERKPTWQQFGDFLEQAAAHTSPVYIWKQLRATIRVYEAYGVDKMEEAARRRVQASIPDIGGLETPSVLEVQYIECPLCACHEFLMVLYDPAAVLGRCVSCGHETRSRAEIRADGTGVPPETDDLLQERTDAVETLARTRGTIQVMESAGRLVNTLSLIPMYRLESQHIRRIRQLTTRIARLMGSELSQAHG